MNTVRLLTFTTLLLFPFLQIQAQPQFGIKFGRLYLIDDQFYEYSTGYSATAFIYPFAKDNFSVGIEAGYLIKGYLDKSFNRSGAINFFSVGIPIRYDFKKSNEIEFYGITGCSYDITLKSNVVDTTTYAIYALNSNFVYSLGAGVDYKETTPRVSIELSYSRALGEFIKNKVTNSFINLKFGISFGGN